MLVELSLPPFEGMSDGCPPFTGDSYNQVCHHICHPKRAEEPVPSARLSHINLGHNGKGILVTQPVNQHRSLSPKLNRTTLASMPSTWLIICELIVGLSIPLAIQICLYLIVNYDIQIDFFGWQLVVTVPQPNRRRPSP